MLFRSLCVLKKSGWISSHNVVTGLGYSEAGLWRLRQGNVTLEACLKPRQFVSPFLIILYLKISQDAHGISCEQNFILPIFKDSVSEKEFRQLTYRLRLREDND